MPLFRISLLSGLAASHLLQVFWYPLQYCWPFRRMQQGNERDCHQDYFFHAGTLGVDPQEKKRLLEPEVSTGPPMLRHSLEYGSFG